MAFNNYDPGRHVLVVAGVQIQGFADGTSIKVSRATPTFTDKAGRDGDVVRIKSRDYRGDVEITLLASSPSNDFLSALVIADEQLESGAGSVGPMMLKDLNGTSVCAGPNAWVTQPADLEVSPDAPNRVWKIRVANLKMFVGGLTV